MRHWIGLGFLWMGSCVATPGSLELQPAMGLKGRERTGATWAIAVYPAELRRWVANASGGFEPPEDFRRIRALGFDALLIRQAEVEELPALAGEARRAGLHVVWEPPQLTRQIRVGAVNNEEVMGTLVEVLKKSEVVANAIGIESWGGNEKAAWAKRAANQLEAEGLAALIYGGDEASRGMPAAPSLIRLSEEDPAMFAESLLRQYHQQLMQGRTGPLMVDGICALPGDGPDLLQDGAPVPARAALSGLLERHRRWSASIRGARLVERSTDPGAPVATAMLVRDSFRWTLVWNGGMAVARARTKVCAGDGERRFERAVEVPSGPLPAGRVFDQRDGQILADVVLGPGDAQLFECF